MKSYDYQTAIFENNLNIVQQDHKLNVITIRNSQGSTRIESIIACWASQNPSDDPTLLRLGRILVVTGDVSANTAIDPIIPIAQQTDKSVQSIQRVIKDILTCGGGHRVIELTNLGIVVEPGETVSVIQTPMYSSGDISGSPRPTCATLCIDVTQLYNDGNNNSVLKLR